MAKEKLYGKPLYVIGRGSVTIPIGKEKKSFRADGVPIPENKLTEDEANKLIKSKFLTEAPQIAASSTDTDKLKAQIEEVSALNKELEKEKANLEGQIKTLTDQAAEQAEKVTTLETENAELKGLAGGN